jgi:methionyl-tRNA formyltransferase
MKVVFLGNAAWSVRSLESLAASSHRVDRVLTRVPRPAGRGSRLSPTPVAEAARLLTLPLTEVETVRSGVGFEELARAEPDVLAVVAYGEILPQAVLDVPRVAPVNVHFSLLPELRGAAPVQRALMEGLTATGVTTIRMNASMDTGPILLQAEEAILPDDDAGTLGGRLAAIGGRLLVDTLDRLEAGALEERTQDDSLATYAPKVKPEDRVIRWDREADAIVNQVRALSPEPGAVTTFRGRNLKILGASTRALNFPSGIPPAGTVFLANGGDWGPVPVVSTGTTRVVVLEKVSPEGRHRMSGADFLRGYRPQVGEILGGPPHEEPANRN